MDLTCYEAFPVIATPRLRLRELTADDSAMLFEMFRDPEVTRFYDISAMTDLAQAQSLTERLRRRFHDRNGIRWAIESTADGRFLGTCGYPVIVASADRGSIGYELVRTAWGQGVATEAVGAIVDFGHRTMELHRIDALVVTGNDASTAVLRKCGFCEEGVLRGYARIHGRHRDMQMFAHLDPATA